MPVPKGLNLKWEKDIFIDAQIANKFASPPNEYYSELINWILAEDKTNPNNNAALMLSEKLIQEYIGGNRLSKQGTSIGVMINRIIASQRFNSVGMDIIKDFKRKHIFSCKQKQRGVYLKCNSKDYDHLPLVFYSNRKLAIIDDTGFLYSVLNFPKFSKGVNAQRSPEKLKYK